MYVNPSPDTKTGWRTVSPSPFLYLSLNPQNQAPPTKTRVLMRKARGANAYWTYTKGAHRA